MRIEFNCSNGELLRRKLLDHLSNCQRFKESLIMSRRPVLQDSATQFPVQSLRSISNPVAQSGWDVQLPRINHVRLHSTSLRRLSTQNFRPSLRTTDRKLPCHYAKQLTRKRPCFSEINNHGKVPHCVDSHSMFPNSVNDNRNK